MDPLSAKTLWQARRERSEFYSHRKEGRVSGEGKDSNVAHSNGEQDTKVYGMLMTCGAEEDDPLSTPEDEACIEFWRGQARFGS